MVDERLDVLYSMGVIMLIEAFPAERIPVGFDLWITDDEKYRLFCEEIFGGERGTVVDQSIGGHEKVDVLAFL